MTAEIERKIRLDVHGRPKPLLRGWIHAIATPLALAAGIVLICLAHGTGLKWACAVFMTCSLVLFGNSACYHLGDWSPRVTDVLRRIDHMNIFLLIAGTYTPVSFALTPFWRDSILWRWHVWLLHPPCVECSRPYCAPSREWSQLSPAGPAREVGETQIGNHLPIGHQLVQPFTIVVTEIRTGHQDM